ncbi:MAG: zinc ribbon domain-containing protein [Parascardovia denticolens]
MYDGKENGGALCPRCKAPITQNEEFCPNCGLFLSPGTDTAEPFRMPVPTARQQVADQQPMPSQLPPLNPPNSFASSPKISQTWGRQPAREKPAQRSFAFMIATAAIVLFFILASSFFFLFIKNSAEGTIRSYVEAVARGDATLANSYVSVGNRTLSARPAKRIAKVNITMDSRDHATITYELSGKKMRQTVEAERRNVFSAWRISKGLEEPINLQAPVGLVTVGGSEQTVRKTGNHETAFVQADDVVKGYAIKLYTLNVKLVPGVYDVKAASTHWYEATASRFATGPGGNATDWEVSKTLIPHSLSARLTQAIKDRINGCIAKKQVTVPNCSFANPDVSGLDPKPTGLNRKLLGDIRIYAIDMESRKFTTDFISTTASYEFAKKGDTIERTITMKKFVRGTWSMEKDGSFNVELE